jgi:CRISPR-associated protein Csd2
MSAIANRYEFVYLFDVTNGNPNGDPDAGNLPRLDPETSKGLVSDVCLKRKVRNYVQMAREEAPGFGIYMQERGILNRQHQKAWEAKKIEPDQKTKYARLPKDAAKAHELTDWMCANFFDIRAFGAVMTTEVNCGQVRGPVQVAFASSIEPIVPLEVSITRMAATNEKDAESKGDIRTMGRKHIVPYGLYRAHGFVSAKLAAKTGFSTGDLDLLWEALRSMFEHDRSAARGEMTARRLIVFQHDSDLGNAPAHALFDLVDVRRANGNNRSEEPARSYGDYVVSFAKDRLPQGVQASELI